MTIDTLPEPTPDVLAAVETILARCGVAWRIIGGSLRIKPARSLTADDRELIQRYGPAFKAWIIAGRPSVIAPPQFDPSRCYSCGEADPDRHVYQTDRAGELIVVCVPCGVAWAWDSGYSITSRERAFYGRTLNLRRLGQSCSE